MNDIYTTTIGLKEAEKIYFIDANILIAMSNFYYKGFAKDQQFTEKLKAFILLARNNDMNCDFAIIESSYDYNTNLINTETLNAFMIAFDNLLMNFESIEFGNYTGNGEPLINRKTKQICSYKSVFDCKLPNYLFNDEIGTINLFYEVYLYKLKLIQLYNSKIKPMEKVKKYFDYIINKIDIFLGVEFFIGVMLLIGSDEQNKIASQVLKPNNNTDLMKFLNPIIDIMNYRRTCFVADWSVKMKEPKQAIFVTTDKALQSYIELNRKFNTIMSSDMITPVINFAIDINPKYLEEWENYYNSEYLPCIYKRNMNLHLYKKTEEEKDKRLALILNQIEIIEPLVLK